MEDANLNKSKKFNFWRDITVFFILIMVFGTLASGAFLIRTKWWWVPILVLIISVWIYTFALTKHERKNLSK